MTTQSPLAATKKSVEDILGSQNVRARFDAILREKSPGFLASVLSVWKEKLRDVEPWSVVSSAMIAASIDLPIIGSLGYAAIVPYKGVAQFQMQWKGYVQLALRTGQYQNITASEVYDDEFVSWNPMTNEFKYTPVETWKNRHKEDGSWKHVVGYVSYFQLITGFEHYLYMTMDQITAHGKRYSPSYRKGNGLWVENPHVMRLKTPIKLNLNKFGMLSVDLKRAIKYDSALLLPPPPGREIENLDEPQMAHEDEVDAAQEAPLKSSDERGKDATPAIAAPQGAIKEPPADYPKNSREGMAEKTAQFAMECSDCGKKIAEGETIFYDAKNRKAYHRPDCAYVPG